MITIILIIATVLVILAVASSQRSSSAARKSTGLFHFLFYQRNPILQIVYGVILYSGFFVYLMGGYQWLPENSWHRVFSLFTCFSSMISFALASSWHVNVLISPAHHKYRAKEFRQALLEASRDNEVLNKVSRECFATDDEYSSFLTIATNISSPNATVTNQTSSTTTTTTTITTPPTATTPPPTTTATSTATTPPENKTDNNTATFPSISAEASSTVSSRYAEFWYDLVGRYRYDNITSFAETWCNDCQQPRPARAKHCTLCNHCVDRYDHHCIWLNMCIGSGNYWLFVTHLYTQSLLLTYGTYSVHLVLEALAASHGLHTMTYQHPVLGPQPLSWVMKQQAMAHQYPLLVAAFYIMIFLGLPVLAFAFWHTYLVCKNRTTHEDGKREYVRKWIKRTFHDGLDWLSRSHDEIQTHLQRDMKQFANDTLIQSFQTHLREQQESLQQIPSHVREAGLDEHNPWLAYDATIVRHLTDEQKRQLLDTYAKDHPDKPLQLATLNECVLQVLRQQRPEGFQGWFEPPCAPFVTNSTMRPDAAKIPQCPSLPSSKVWSREYFLTAVEHNKYNLGSIVLNAKDALGLLSQHDCVTQHKETASSPAHGHFSEHSPVDLLGSLFTFYTKNPDLWRAYIERLKQRFPPQPSQSSTTKID